MEKEATNLLSPPLSCSFLLSFSLFPSLPTPGWSSTGLLELPDDSRHWQALSRIMVQTLTFPATIDLQGEA